MKKLNKIINFSDEYPGIKKLKDRNTRYLSNKKKRKTEKKLSSNNSHVYNNKMVKRIKDINQYCNEKVENIFNYNEESKSCFVNQGRNTDLKHVSGRIVEWKINEYKMNASCCYYDSKITLFKHKLSDILNYVYRSFLIYVLLDHDLNVDPYPADQQKNYFSDLKSDMKLFVNKIKSDAKDVLFINNLFVEFARTAKKMKTIRKNCIHFFDRITKKLNYVPFAHKAYLKLNYLFFEQIE